MNIDKIDLELTTQRYVLGKLSEPEAEAFEAYFLDKPELIDMVESAQNMHIGMQQAAAASESQSANGTVTRDDSLLRKLLEWVSVPIPAYAVLVVAAIVAPIAIDGLKQESPSSAISLVNFSTDITRSASAPVTLDLSQVDGDPALLIKLKKVEYRDYKLRIRSADTGQAVWKSQPFQVSALRDHLVLIPQHVAIADAVIEVVGMDSNRKEVDVEFCHYSEVCR